MSTNIRTKPIESFKIVGFTCDKCKNDFTQEYSGTETQEMLRWLHVGGHDSVIGDGNFIDITICQNCWWELFKDFVEIKLYGFDSETGEA